MVYREFFSELEDKFLDGPAALEITKQVLPQIPELWVRTLDGERLKVVVYVPDPQDPLVKRVVRLTFLDRARKEVQPVEV